MDSKANIRTAHNELYKHVVKDFLEVKLNKPFLWFIKFLTLPADNFFITFEL